MKRLLFLFNAHAGRGRIKTSLSDVIELFINADYEVTVHSTKGRGDAMEIAKTRGEEFDIIVASGGDGTLSEVVNGIMPLEKKPDIGFIPVGTTNDFAMNFKISKVNVYAAESIVIGKPYAYDIGSFNDQYFNYVAAFGLFADVSYATPQAYKNAIGRLAYLIEGARSLTSINTYHIKFTCGEEEIEDDFIFGIISNANTIGGFKRITGNSVSLNDGLFEVMLISKPATLMEFKLIIDVMLNNESNNKNIYKFKTDKISYESEKLVDWALDGEYGGSMKRAVITNHKQAVNFIVEESVITELDAQPDFDNKFDEERIITTVDDNYIIDKFKNKISLDYDYNDEPNDY